MGDREEPGARNRGHASRVLRGRLRLEGIQCDYVDDTIVGEAEAHNILSDFRSDIFHRDFQHKIFD